MKKFIRLLITSVLATVLIVSLTLNVMNNMKAIEHNESRIKVNEQKIENLEKAIGDNPATQP